jgi:hypothetical protein
MQLIPERIAKRVIHPGDDAQINGFEELFVLLNTDQDAGRLRKLIVDYFNNTPFLREHLS